MFSDMQQILQEAVVGLKVVGRKDPSQKLKWEIHQECTLVLFIPLPLLPTAAAITLLYFPPLIVSTIHMVDKLSGPVVGGAKVLWMLCNICMHFKSPNSVRQKQAIHHVNTLVQMKSYQWGFCNYKSQCCVNSTKVRSVTKVFKPSDIQLCMFWQRRM